MIRLIAGLTPLIMMLGGCSFFAEEKTDLTQLPPRATVVYKTGQLYLGLDDSLELIDTLISEPNPQRAMDIYEQQVLDLYWKKKDLPNMVLFARAGIQHGYTLAWQVRQDSPELAFELRSRSKALAYNLASFTWPGWNEPGIVIGPVAQAIGMDAARINLRLAQELRKDDHALSKAWWVLGAQQLAAKDYTEAHASFEKSAEFAKSAHKEEKIAEELWNERKGGELLAQGFAALTEILKDPADNDEAAHGQLEHAVNALKILPGGQLYIDQIFTAQKVFEGRAS